MSSSYKIDLKGTFVAGVYLSEAQNHISTPLTDCIRVYRARIFKLLRSSRIDSKGSTLPAYVAWRTGTTT
jgi:hypothetical protein